MSAQVKRRRGKRNGGPRKRNAPCPPFRFRRVCSDRAGLISLRNSAKRNETAVFGGVTGKASRFARQHTNVARKEPETQWVSPSDPAGPFAGPRKPVPRPLPARSSPEYALFDSLRTEVCLGARCLAGKCLANAARLDSQYCPATARIIKQAVCSTSEVAPRRWRPTDDRRSSTCAVQRLPHQPSP